jgi:SHS2 domain-containing protein
VGSFEIIEHTADVGIRAFGSTLEELFEQATLGLAEIIGLGTRQPGVDEPVSLTADDLGGLLVDWLSEVLYLHEVRDSLLGGVHLDEVTEHRAAGHLTLVQRAGEVEGTQVKAITYHRLKVERGRDGWMAQVYVDV